jgi:hypothetical protein
LSGAIVGRFPAAFRRRRIGRFRAPLFPGGFSRFFPGWRHRKTPRSTQYRAAAISDYFFLRAGGRDVPLRGLLSAAVFFGGFAFFLLAVFGISGPVRDSTHLYYPILSRPDTRVRPRCTFR